MSEALSVACVTPDCVDLSIATLRAAYRAGTTTPRAVLADIRERCRQTADWNIWITPLEERQLNDCLAALDTLDPARAPLWGIPFAIKDNIDLANTATTAACPAFTTVPGESAFVVDCLVRAGAIPVGKTNMDQFATGLVGTRSPFGATCNSFSPEFISGGSSSGSAVAVSLGLATFALGTDTAGSGRIPAGFNQLVGMKPTRGLLGTSGVVPACRTLDCISIFALNPDDLAAIMPVVTVADDRDCYSRHDIDRLALAAAFGEPDTVQAPFTFGIPDPDQLTFFGAGDYGPRFAAAIAQMQAAGGTAVEIDFSPFVQAARLLYAGPWVTERYIATRQVLESSPDAMLPVIRDIVAPGKSYTAADTFRAFYQLQELKARADRELQRTDFIMTPTAGGIFTIADVNADPIRLNSLLGYYTNFMNLLDYAAIAIPGDANTSAHPFGITLFSGPGSDAALTQYGRRYLSGMPLQAGRVKSPWRDMTGLAAQAPA